MAKKRSSPDATLTPLELAVMQALWEVGPATLQAVHASVAARRPVAYTTVQTMLNVLHRKGKVARALRHRAYVYRASVSREGAARSAVANLIRNMFGGSPASLVLSMVDAEQLDAATLDKVRGLMQRGKNK